MVVSRAAEPSGARIECMNSVRFWRAGAILLLAGGVLLTVLFLLAGRVALPRVAPLGYVAIGLGLVFAGVGIRRRYPACWLLMVAGGAWMLEGLVLGIVPLAVPPRWIFVAVVLIVAIATVAAAIGMVARGRVPVVARWALVLPAIATAVTVVGWTIGLPAVLGFLAPWTLGAPVVTPVLVGLVWLFVRDSATAERSSSPFVAIAQPNVNE
jgi:hypothetical protein